MTRRGVTGGPERTARPVESDRFWQVLREPAIPIILVAGLVHIARRNAADIAIFFGTAGIILADRRWNRCSTAGLSPRRSMSSGLPIRAAVVGCLGYAGVLAFFPRDGWVSLVGLAIPGVVALTAILSQPDSPLSRGAEPLDAPASGWRWWPALGVAGCLWELTSFFQQPNSQTDSFRHPTLSSVLDPVLADPLPRALATWCWLLVGGWLVRNIIAGPRGREAGRR